MGMSYLTSLNTQLFKNIAYVGSFGHYPVQITLHVFCSLFFSAHNSSGIQLQDWQAGFRIVSFTNPLAAGSEAGNLSRWAPVCPLVSDATAECQIVIVMLMCGIYKFFLGRVKFSGLYFAF